MDLAFAEADGCVERGKTAEADRDGRHGRARAQGTVFFLEDWGEVGGHGWYQITAKSQLVGMTVLSGVDSGFHPLAMKLPMDGA